MHASHVCHSNRITPVRIIERLVGDKAVDVGCLDASVIEAGFDAFEMERMRACVGSLADSGFRYADDGVFAANVTHGSSSRSDQVGVMEYWNDEPSNSLHFFAFG